MVSTRRFAISNWAPRLVSTSSWNYVSHQGTYIIVIGLVGLSSKRGRIWVVIRPSLTIDPNPHTILNTYTQENVWRHQRTGRGVCWGPQAVLQRRVRFHSNAPRFLAKLLLTGLPFAVVRSMQFLNRCAKPDKKGRRFYFLQRLFILWFVWLVTDYFSFTLQSRVPANFSRRCDWFHCPWSAWLFC